MGKTYFSIGVDDASEAWRDIRSQRAAPGDSLKVKLTGHRKDVFQTALEQSQQQFQAARGVGYESRPLNLFYGLAQAGRALCAASIRLGPPNPSPQDVWLPEGGHGLKFNPTLSASKGLLGQPIDGVPGKSDAFSRLSYALASPLDFGQMTFSALLAQIPEVWLQFRRTDWGPVALLPDALYEQSMDPGAFPRTWHVDPVGLSELGPRSLETARSWTKQYPALGRLELETDDAGDLAKSHNPPYLVMKIATPDDLEEIREGNGHVPLGSQTYRRHTAMFPNAGESSHALHPLASWWMLLFALSMLARYSPRDWAHVTSLADSPIASVLEYVLDEALDAVPNLVAEALEHLNDAP